jgi:hypothetical protein
MAYTGQRPFATMGTGIGANFTQALTPSSSTTPEAPSVPYQLGTGINGGGDSKWMMCVAGGTINADDFVIVQGPGDSGAPQNYTVAQITSTNARSKIGARVGRVIASATVGQYVWVQMGGFMESGNYGTISGAYTALHTTATAGQLSTTSSAGVSATVGGIVISNNTLVNGGLQAWCGSLSITAND